MNWVESFVKTLQSALPTGCPTLALPPLPGVAGALTGITLARLSRISCVWMITPDQVAFDLCYGDLCVLGKTARIKPIPVPHLLDAEDQEALGARARVVRFLRSLSSADLHEDDDTIAVFVSTASAILQPVPDPDALRQASVTLRTGGAFAFDELTERLVRAGYDRVTEVTDPGQMAIRGGVLDVWPPSTKCPWRAEFFGSELESLRTFDPATQRSIEKGDSVWLPPCATPETMPTVHLLDLLPQDAGIVWLDAEGIRQSVGDEISILRQQVVSRKPQIQLFSGDPPPAGVPTVDFPITAVPGLAELGAAEARHPELLVQAREKLLRQFQQDAEAGRWIFLCVDTPGTCELLGREIGDHRRVTIRKMALSGGFCLPQCVVAAQCDLYAVRKKGLRTAASLRKEAIQGARLDQSVDLEPGDLVVHVNHGIGKFLGSTEIEQAGVRVEVFTVEYADGAKIHVPVSHAHLLSRYVGSHGQNVKLHSLNGKRWSKEKMAAEHAVEDLAATLLDTQAKRQVIQGISFDPNPQWMNEFEADFPYQETSDQERCIAEVKQDMASSRPMDRLICGDAGYGKTEVAMRAAFCAVMNGYQVAVLAPTTVLAEQHYETFCDRMGAYPVRIEVVDRFHGAAKCARVFQATAKGEVDILIGTHALLSGQVSFPNLGLLIIDEEQRFGVAHKEKLKRMRQMIDVLTLSATPIPRTLYMSMTGARDMSLLQSPPRERVAVETRVARDQDAVLRQAISQEIHRGGQVYFLYNRIATIYAMLERLRQILPEVRFAVAHARMPSGELEKVMGQFETGEIDVLLCTTLVENGLDIPRANTMIVHRADRFGISDLYQLRGRVGRSSVKGFAWLLTPENGIVDEDARERIAALRKHSGLGAGFHLALRDLEIRGSGNLLGAAQSGHIAAVGFGLYCQLLRRTIARMRGEKLAPLVDVALDLDFIDLSPGMGDPSRAACLPYNYIDEDGHRMLFHRKLAEANVLRELVALKREMVDRFGAPPLPALRLFRLMELRIEAASRNISRIMVKEGRVALYPRDTNAPLYVDHALPVLHGKTVEQRIASLFRILKEVALMHSDHK